ncbi:archease family protein [Archaeoglobus sulfaticallidus PM70-1]|uniref:Protein archease n=1 Tax=Archaeoglobus sulfaticallidus PM70-1 TaxID=387631 RepID=N0BIP7_9EURY|nr:archease [Archaeoglobus sulfaticallidus]AGK60346.1 archease family protein [Archaeoglobus sulfaticallidus PM70-1]
MEGYRLINHTADIAFEAYGYSLEELFENATRAFYDAFAVLESVGIDREQIIEMEDSDIEMLFFRYLNELLYLFDTDFFAGKEVNVSIEDVEDELRLKAKLKGGKISPEIVKTEPKAITLHKFMIEKVKNEKEFWKAFVVVDI